MSPEGGNEALVFACTCGTRMRVTRADFGRRGRCRDCGASFVLSAENTCPHVAASQQAPTTLGSESLERAAALANAGRYVDARLSLQPLLEQEPSNAEAWYAVAYCYYKEADYSQATATAERARQLGSSKALQLLVKIRDKAGAEPVKPDRAARPSAATAEVPETAEAAIAPSPAEDTEEVDGAIAEPAQPEPAQEEEQPPESLESEPVDEDTPAIGAPPESVAEEIAIPQEQVSAESLCGGETPANAGDMACPPSSENESEDVAQTLTEAPDDAAVSSTSFAALDDEHASVPSEAAPQTDQEVSASPKAAETSSAAEQAREAAGRVAALVKRGAKAAVENAVPLVTRASEAATRKVEEIQKNVSERAAKAKAEADRAAAQAKNEARSGGEAASRESEQPPVSESRPATTSSEEAVRFDDLRQRCMVDTDVTPISVKQAARKRGDLVFPVILNTARDGVTIEAKEVSKAYLSKILLAQLPWVILQPVFMVAGVIMAVLNFVLMLGCLFGLNFVNVFGCMWNACLLGSQVLIAAFYYVRFLYRFLTVLYYFVSGKPYVFLPVGVEMTNEGIIAAFSRNQCPQILRLNLSKTLLSKQSAKEKMQGCGCITLPVSLIIRAGTSLFDILLGMVTVQEERNVLFAFVAGDPVVLTPQPNGFFERIKARREAKKCRRAIYFVSVNPDSAEQVHREVEASLGTTIQVVDDNLAETTFWL